MIKHIGIHTPENERVRVSLERMNVEYYSTVERKWIAVITTQKQVTNNFLTNTKEISFVVPITNHIYTIIMDMDYRRIIDINYLSNPKPSEINPHRQLIHLRRESYTVSYTTVDSLFNEILELNRQLFANILDSDIDKQSYERLNLTIKRLNNIARHTKENKEFLALYTSAIEDLVYGNNEDFESSVPMPITE